MVAVEFNSVVSVRSLGNVLSHSGSKISYIYVYYEDAVNYIPADHLVQVVLQMVCITLNFATYMCTCETGGFYKILLYCPDTVLSNIGAYMATNAALSCAWAH